MTSRDYLNILHIAERLKDTTRHCTTSKRRVESVAEHSWRVSLMALLLRNEFPDIDIDRVVSMCLVHDLGECFTGDIPTFHKTDADRKKEDSLLNEWIEGLPREVSDDLKDLYKEMESQETTEARLYSTTSRRLIHGQRMNMNLTKHTRLIRLLFLTGLQISGVKY